MDISTFARAARALSDTRRVRMLLALQGGELCACQLIELVHLAPSTVSKHMAALRGAGLVESRKEGRWMYYRLAEGPRRGLGQRLVRLCAKGLADDRTVATDHRRLRAICTTDPAALCRARRESAAACSRRQPKGKDSV